MRAKVAPFAPLAVALLPAGCRPPQLQEAEARHIAARELSSFATRHGIDQRRYKLSLPRGRGNPKEPWLFFCRLDGKEDHEVTIMIARRRHADVWSAWIVDGDLEATPVPQKSRWAGVSPLGFLSPSVSARAQRAPTRDGPGPKLGAASLGTASPLVRARRGARARARRRGSCRSRTAA